MYNKVLIISDNIFLSKKIQIILNNLNLDKVSFSFAISISSKKKEFDEVLNKECQVYDLKREVDINKIIKIYDLVFSVHCKQLFPQKLVNNIKCINLHPGYNPYNRGWYPQVFAIINDLRIGATIHEIDNKLDHGPIIVRELIQKSNIDTSGTLYEKIIDLELKLFKENIASIIKDNYSVFLPEKGGNIFFKKDFNKLCKLDLNEKLTTLQFINKLRALTHDGFKNAFFVDSVTKEKIYISLNIDKS